MYTTSFHERSDFEPTDYMDVSENSGTPKWMVYFMENPIFLMDDLGGFNPLFSETPICFFTGG